MNVTTSVLCLTILVVLAFVASLVFKKDKGSIAGAGSTVVVDVKMPFSSMVVFMIKWALAAIPAMVVLALIGALLVPIAAAIVGMLR